MYITPKIDELIHNYNNKAKKAGTTNFLLQYVNYSQCMLTTILKILQDLKNLSLKTSPSINRIPVIFSSCGIFHMGPRYCSSLLANIEFSYQKTSLLVTAANA